MKRIKVMVNGTPGKVAVVMAQHILRQDQFDLIAHSLTGPEITAPTHRIDTLDLYLIRPDDRDQRIEAIKRREGSFISLDYTHPSAVNENAAFYCRHHLPFVMGTTGGDRPQLHATVMASDISAVIAPNMAKQIVGFQAMMEYAANTFPGLFDGYSLEIKESHQHGKADTSGTAKAMVAYFNKLGVEFSEADIVQERDPQRQKTVWGIPEAYLSGHGWHTYTLQSPDKTVRFEFTHNINGRDIYVQGSLDAIRYLDTRIAQGSRGQVFTMVDVLKGA